MNKRQLFIVLIAVCSPLVIWSSAFSQSDKPSDKQPDPLSDYPLSKLQQMIDKAKVGDILRPPRGRYSGNSTLKIIEAKNLTVIFTKDSQVLCGDINADVVTIQDCQNIRLVRGLFRHVKPLTEYECHGSVVRVDNGKNIKLMEMDLNGCGAIGVAARKSQQLTVYGCLIHLNTFNAFYLSECDDVLIASNRIEKNGNLIQLYNVEGLEMMDNTITNNNGYWIYEKRLQKELSHLLGE